MASGGVCCGLRVFFLIIPRIEGHCGRLPDEAAEVEDLNR